MPQLDLALEDQRQLLSIARSSILARLHGSPTPTTSLSAALRQSWGAFVTLRIHGKLRGCIGRIRPMGSLASTIAEMAEAAAFEDPRFPALGESEYPHVQLELTILSALRHALRADEIIAGVHGVSLTLGNRSAVFLPQVATEQGWDRLTLLDELALKAGLPDRAWQNPKAILEIFEGLIIDEEPQGEPQPIS